MLGSMVAASLSTERLLRMCVAAPLRFSPEALFSVLPGEGLVVGEETFTVCGYYPEGEHV